MKVVTGCCCCHGDGLVVVGMDNSPLNKVIITYFYLYYYYFSHGHVPVKSVVRTVMP